MKNLIIWLGIIISLLGLSACNTQEEHAHTHVYTCPMHPQIRENQPGICPICKMDLVPLGESSHSNEIALDAQKEALAGISYTKVDSSSKVEWVWLSATLEEDHERSSSISTKLPGKVIWLRSRTPGSKIRKGEAVARLYSEPFEAMQREILLNLHASDPLQREIAQKGLQKLALLEVSAAQLQQLKTSGLPLPYLEIIASSDGVIKTVNSSEGAFINAGATLFELESYEALLAEARAAPALLRSVKVGQMVKINLGNGQLSEGRIYSIAPELGPDNQARFQIKLTGNAGELLPGQYIKVGLLAGNQSGLWVPTEAVIRSEQENWVFIAKNNYHFMPKKVSIGAETATHIQVLEGLNGKETLVSEGAYLLYSEMKLHQSGASEHAH